MKKIICILAAGIIAASMCVVLAGCGGSKGSEMPTAASTAAPTTKPAATVATTRPAANNNAAVNSNNDNAGSYEAQESQVQESQNDQSSQQSSQAQSSQSQEYVNSAPGGNSLIQGEQAAGQQALGYMGGGMIVDSEIRIDNGEAPYYKVSIKDDETGDVNTVYVYGDGSVIPEGD